MNFKIGDKVAVLDDVIKGKVVKIQPNKITVESEDGFPLDFLPKELVIVHKNQADLAKFSDISNDALIEKTTHKTSKRKQSLFKTDSKPDKLPPMEVDLHINHLIPSTRGMDNFDILTTQLNTAKHKLEFAIKNRIPKIVFIHGVGEGVLKSELEYLLKNYHVDYYEASFQKYGLGATEVYIYQNPRN